ncbi:MAG: pyrroline-5-carboxylate reductase [Gemmatimonas sp.]|uniref:pyrroline-5-carboxylate reductase n=1 Tax=Gemmatimonas sp. UBA7669 TaxID=1946568 RepID=UPI0025C4AB8D|nr:pyrroline-5-carboxylate reductase [Gemmatimonas sp. UBA7669]MBA3919266.1 pyrroline-5-carboxylate reductase [Gemmatimonas sp.]
MSPQHTLSSSIAIIGVGTMGRAIASGLVHAGVVTASQLALADRDISVARDLATQLTGARWAHDAATAGEGADIVLLCVKPNDVAQALAELHLLSAHVLVVSIAAGMTLSTLEQLTGGLRPVVRAMPNTPCLIGQGHTVLSAGRHATAEHLQEVEQIFRALGTCQVLAEKHLDAVTALSASGPAFVYVMIEALAAGGLACGLSREVSTFMAARTALGAAAMVLETGSHPAELRDQVSSPGGCTIAGLLALEDGGFRSVVSRAVEVTTRAAAGLGAR